ncbi:hypothetical protein LTR85_009071 [Meristemomyces frigidus]|nr:hypothetical protein LTR85_009071 [Meristemomyces frigidus]
MASSSSKDKDKHPRLSKVKGWLKGRDRTPRPSLELPETARQLPARAGLPPVTTVTSLSAPAAAQGSQTSVHLPSALSKQQANVSPSPNARQAVVAPFDIKNVRNELWKKAYESLRSGQPTVIEAYEALAKDQNGLQVTGPLRPDSILIVVQKQKRKLESKQWTYTWFGKPQRVRDNVESVLKVVQEASGLISAGMTLAPVYVSLPWSMISILIPFVMNDSQSMASAIDGLKEITAIMASYSYAEKEFLKHEVARSDFQDIVADLYAAILEYQASVAIYFAKSTLKRLGLSLSSKLSWTEAIAKTRNLDSRCRVALQALATSLGQHEFGSMEKLLQHGMKLMQQISQSLSAERNQRQRIIDWVSPINPYQDHADVRRLLGDEYFGTGQWLLRDDQQYLPWKASDRDVLLLQGGMGTGKSSLVSVVIEDLMGDVDSRLAFMYCSANASPLDRNRTIRNDTGNIIRCLLAQCAVLADGSIVPSIQAAFDRSGRQEPGGCDLSLGAAIIALKDVVHEHPNGRVTLVIDALDECTDVGEVLMHLKDVQKSISTVRVFFSARPGVDISDHFGSIGFRSVSVGSLNRRDVEGYIDAEICRRYEASGMDTDQAKRLEKALNRLAEGLFRWVVLEIDIFLPRSRRQGTRQMKRDIERRLAELEASRAPPVERLMGAYGEVYAMAIGAEDEHSRRYSVQSAIKWVLCSFRPLTVQELLAAAAVQPDGTHDDDISDFVLFEYCSNLLVTAGKGRGSFVRLAHLSVRQFFETRTAQDFRPERQHNQAAMTCLWIRSKEHDVARKLLRARENPYEGQPAKTVTGSSELEEFVVYCIHHWPLHYRACHKDRELHDLYATLKVRFIEPMERLFVWVADAVDLGEHDICGDTMLHRVTRAHLTEELFFLLYVDAVLTHGSLVRAVSGNGNTALHLACQLGFSDFVDRLLRAKAEIGVANNAGLTPLHLAVLFNCHDTMIGAEALQLQLDSQDPKGNALIHYATYFDRPAHARRLIERDCDLRSQDRDGNTPLDIAAMVGSNDMLTLLRSAGADGSHETGFPRMSEDTPTNIHKAPNDRTLPSMTLRQRAVYATYLNG